MICGGPLTPPRSTKARRKLAYGATPPAFTTTSLMRSPEASSIRATSVCLPTVMALPGSAPVPRNAPRTSTTSWSTAMGGTNSTSPPRSSTSGAPGASARARSRVPVSFLLSGPTRVSRASLSAPDTPPVSARSAASVRSSPIS